VNSPVIPNGEILVTDGRIAAVGDKVEAPADAAVIDAAGRVVMPGFVDCHTHACWAGDRLDEWERSLGGAPVPRGPAAGAAFRPPCTPCAKRPKNNSLPGSASGSA
jgi:imidazolonepropionase